MDNPKLKGSNIIDCIPQTGECPLNCSECYYNGGRFYRTLDEPLIPSFAETLGKIVRVNSGHDSNLDFENVMKTTSLYAHKFYNTSIPSLRFKAPTVLTINGRDTDRSFYHLSDLSGDPSTLMAVRFRVNTWNLGLCKQAIDEWVTKSQFPVPFVLTDMRYFSKEAVRNPEDYIFGKHLLNSYWKLNDTGLKKVLLMTSFGPSVYWCGNPFSRSSLCADCRLCEHFYMIASRKVEGFPKKETWEG